MRSAIKPRQIINYDAGIVLIDLHQLNVNNFRQYKSMVLNTGQPHVNEEQNPEQQPATSAFLTKWLNKLTSLLSKKGPGISQLWSLKPAVGDYQKREHIHHSAKWWRMNIPRSSLRTDDIVNSLNYEGIAIELQFYHFPDSGQTACWLCHRLNSLND